MPGTPHARPARFHVAALALATAMSAAAPAVAAERGVERTARAMEVRAFGPSFPGMNGPARLPDGRMSLETRQSVGCLLLGTAMTGASALAGAENLINIIGGGVVQPRSQSIVFLGTLGITFGTFCAVGAALTPLWDDLTGAPQGQGADASAASRPATAVEAPRAPPTRAHGVLADRIPTGGSRR
jgi:hypothetical protein